MSKLYRNFIYLLLITLIFGLAQQISAQTAPQSETRKKSTFTNDDFDTAPKSSTNSGSTSTASTATSGSTVKESSEGIQVQGLDMQFRLLDLQLQSAQNPDDRNIRDEMIRLRSLLKDQPYTSATSADLRDLKFRERFIELKIAIVQAEQEADDASSNIQVQRRKVLKGRRGRNGLEGVRDAQQNAQLEQQDVEVLKARLTALIEEGRQAGVGPRAFR